MCIRDSPLLVPQRDQHPVPRQQPRVRLLRRLGPVQARPVPRRRVLRVGNVLLGPPVRGELPPPAPPDRLRELRVGVVGEELPGRGGAPLLAHEEHGGIRRGEREGRRAGQQPRRQRRREPVALRPVADLVVGLGVPQQPVRREPAAVQRPPVLPPAEAGVRAVVEEPGGQRLGQRGERVPGEILVVALRLAGQRGVHRVVEVVVPLGVQPQAARLAGGDQARVVQVGLGDQEQRTAQPHRQPVHRRGELLQEVVRPGVAQRVHRVQPQPVQPVVPQPGQGAVHQELADLVRTGGVQVHRGAPRRVVRVGEVRAERGQVVARRTEVVVDHVEHDAQAQLVRPVHEPLEGLRTPVRLVHRPEGDALVAPAVPAGERAERHQLHVGDAQIRQVLQPRRGRVQGALGRERADVQLVEDRARQRPPRPVHPPPVAPVVDDGAQPVRAVRLPPRARVRQHRPVVHREPVPRPVPGLGLRRPPPPAQRVGFHRVLAPVAMERHPACLRRPHLELHERLPFVPAIGQIPWLQRVHPASPRDHRAPDQTFPSRAPPHALLPSGDFGCGRPPRMPMHGL